MIVYLRRLDEKLDRVVDRLQELTARVSTMEQQYALVQRWLDRMDDRLNRIERRLDLTPASSIF